MGTTAKITEKTGLPIGMVFTLCTIVFGGGGWMTAQEIRGATNTEKIEEVLSVRDDIKEIKTDVCILKVTLTKEGSVFDCSKEKKNDR